MYQQFEWLLGQKGSTEIQAIIQASSNTPKSIAASIVGIVTLLLGASGVFGQLKDALNSVWAEILSFAVLVVLFAHIFKVLPDVEIGWEDVWIGATVTGLLFTIGKSLIGLYLGRSSIGSSFGAAGAIILVLLWVYYSTTILFLGTEFTKVYARRFGSGINPSPNACFVSESMQFGQGLRKIRATRSNERSRA